MISINLLSLTSKLTPITFLIMSLSNLPFFFKSRIFGNGMIFVIPKNIWV